jgi:hypothetical protein
MRVAAGVLATVAVLCMGVVIADMATRRDAGRRGWLLRATAVVSFGAAVALNVLAR